MKALVFDFETTGLVLHPNTKPDKQPRAIEFAGLLVDREGRELRELTFLINPCQQISAEITKITHLTNEDLAPAKLFREYLVPLRGIFSAADILIAHNLPFDHSMMAHELATCGALEGWPWPKHNVCTAQLYEPLWGRRPKLIDLYQDKTGKVYEQTHRALDDVRALAEIVHKENIIDEVAATPGAYGIYLPTGFRADQQGCRNA